MRTYISIRVCVCVCARTFTFMHECADVSVLRCKVIGLSTPVRNWRYPKFQRPAVTWPPQSRVGEEPPGCDVILSKPV
jgi:hypothetical protein